MSDELAVRLSRIRDDVALRSAPVATFALIDIANGSVVHGEPPSTDVTGFGEAGYLLVVGGRLRLLDGSLGTEELAVDIASYLQDMVIDESGAGWPELYEDGAFVTLLEPGLRDGEAAWLGTGGRSVPLGRLWSLGESNS